VIPFSDPVLSLTRTFIIVGNKAATAQFSLDDLSGAAGRMDLLCRAVGAAFFISHDMRRDVVVYLVLLGPPTPPRCVRFSGPTVRNMNPDERNIAGLIRKALAVEDIDPGWSKSSPGIDVTSKDLKAVIDEVAPNPGPSTVYLREDGEPLENAKLGNDVVFLLGDHMGPTPEQEALLKGWHTVSLGKKSYHTDHCIAVVNHELDKTEG
jgi:tRNA (pseudouridine54-N1)-methyltransferase